VLDADPIASVALRGLDRFAEHLLDVAMTVRRRERQ